MTKTYSIERLIELGANRWTKYGKDRLYLRDFIRENLDYKIDKYNTGNIRYAELKGEKISNSMAAKLFASFGDAYIDLTTGKIYTNGPKAEEAIEIIEELLEEVERETEEVEKETEEEIEEKEEGEEEKMKIERLEKIMKEEFERVYGEIEISDERKEELLQAAIDNISEDEAETEEEARELYNSYLEESLMYLNDREEE